MMAPLVDGGGHGFACVEARPDRSFGVVVLTVLARIRLFGRFPVGDAALSRAGAVRPARRLRRLAAHRGRARVRFLLVGHSITTTQLKSIQPESMSRTDPVRAILPLRNRPPLRLCREATPPGSRTLYERYLAGEAIPEDWRSYFAGFAAGRTDTPHGPIVRALDRAGPASRGPCGADAGSAQSEKQAAVSRLIQIYTNRGHLIAKVDPLGLMQRPKPRVMELEYMGLSDADLDTEFFTGSRIDALAAPREAARHHRAARADVRRSHRRGVRACLRHRRAPVAAGPVPARPAAAEIQHGRDDSTSCGSSRRPKASSATCTRKYVGQKRFSLEGGDALIPLLDDLVQRGGESGIEEIVIGMAHRGRLNVLVNVLGKAPSELFSEFEGKYDTAHLQGLGRREVPQGFLRRPAHAGRQRARGAGVQSLAPGGREPGGRGLGARPPGASRRPPRRRTRVAGADPWRLRLSPARAW